MDMMEFAMLSLELQRATLLEVRAIRENDPDFRNHPASMFKKNTLELGALLRRVDEATKPLTLKRAEEALRADQGESAVDLRDGR